MPRETIHVGSHWLNCPNCARKVERAVAGLAGVYDATVEFDTEQATIEYDSDTVTLGRIAHTVEQTGCDSKQFTLSQNGVRLRSTERDIVADRVEGSHEGCCDDEETNNRQPANRLPSTTKS